MGNNVQSSHGNHLSMKLRQRGKNIQRRPRLIQQENRVEQNRLKSTLMWRRYLVSCIRNVASYSGNTVLNKTQHTDKNLTRYSVMDYGLHIIVQKIMKSLTTNNILKIRCTREIAYDFKGTKYARVNLLANMIILSM